MPYTQSTKEDASREAPPGVPPSATRGMSSARQSSTMNIVSRRDFLFRGAQALTALVLAPGLLQGCGSTVENFAFEGNGASLPSLDGLAGLLDGPLLRPGATDFAQLAKPWNLRYADRLPTAIARCQSLKDIANSVAWSQANGVPFVVRSGGHSYSGFSTTSGLLVDISGMRDDIYDPNSGRVTLGPGARNATVYEKLDPLSRSVTHGRCLNVGVAGLALGGGIGFNMRLHGLTCDQLVETDIMLANGEVLRLNENQNSDLFWAVRGAGGGNFGIHTSMTFQTFPVSNVITFNINFTDRLDELLETLMGLVSGFPRELGLKFSVVVKQTDGINSLRLNLLGQLVGTTAELNDLFAPLTAIATPSTSDIQETTYWFAQKNILGEDGSSEYSFERSRYVNQPINSQGIQLILDRMANWPGLPGDAVWKLFVAGGAVSDVAPSATAYVHRQAIGISAVEVEWKEALPANTVNVNREWLDEFHAALAPYTSNQSYQNFIDERQGNFLRAYYGENLERLVEVKRRYDPGNVFTYPQGIPTSLP